MYFFGYNEIEIWSKQFYIGVGVTIMIGILGIALGRGLKVWYEP